MIQLQLIYRCILAKFHVAFYFFFLCRLLNVCGNDMDMIDIGIYVFLLFMLHVFAASILGIIPSLIATPALAAVIFPIIIFVIFVQVWSIFLICQNISANYFFRDFLWSLIDNFSGWKRYPDHQYTQYYKIFCKVPPASGFMENSKIF